MTSDGDQAPGRRWERFDHPAGVGVRSFGNTEAATFEEAARGLCAVLVDPGTVRPAAAVHLISGGHDRVELLTRFLHAVAREMGSRRVILRDFSVRVDDGHASASCFGEGLDADRHEPSADPKGVAITDVAFASTDAGWRAEFVVGSRSD